MSTDQPLTGDKYLTSKFSPLGQCDCPEWDSLLQREMAHCRTSLGRP